MKTAGAGKTKGRQRKYRNKDQMFIVAMDDVLSFYHLPKLPDHVVSRGPDNWTGLEQIYKAMDEAGLLYDADDDGNPVDEKGRRVVTA